MTRFPRRCGGYDGVRSTLTGLHRCAGSAQPTPAPPPLDVGGPAPARHWPIPRTPTAILYGSCTPGTDGAAEQSGTRTVRQSSPRFTGSPENRIPLPRTATDRQRILTRAHVTDLFYSLILLRIHRPRSIHVHQGGPYFEVSTFRTQAPNIYPNTYRNKMCVILSP